MLSRQHKSLRILKEDGSIERYVNNYRFLSYNFGPTLLRWFDDFLQELAQGLVEADAKSIKKRFGHGTAITGISPFYSSFVRHAYDKRTEVTEVLILKRYGRMPEGIWLAETAVDIQTLEVLAEYRDTFFTMAHVQAKAVAKLVLTNGRVLMKKSLDTSRPYLCGVAFW